MAERFIKKTDHCKNIAISLYFQVWKFCGKEQFPHSFWRFARNYAETVPLYKISTSGNYVKLRYFSHWETLHNVTSFSKLSRRHFSADVTKFSEQLSLAPSSSYIVNEKFWIHVKFDNIKTAVVFKNMIPFIAISLACQNEKQTQRYLYFRYFAI